MCFVANTSIKQFLLTLAVPATFEIHLPTPLEMKIIISCVLACLYLQYGVICEPFVGDIYARSSRPLSPPWIPIDDADYWANESLQRITFGLLLLVHPQVLRIYK
jgi:hypothetical protein